MDLDAFLQQHRAIKVSSRSPRAAEVARGVRAGRLVRILPAVFCRAGEEGLPDVRAAAICAADDTAVLTGRAAAALTGYLDDWPATVTFATARAWRTRQEWACPSRTIMPTALVARDPLPHVALPVALLQMACSEGAALIDDALRDDVVTPDDLLAGVQGLAHTAGNAQRRRIVAGSLQRPWSSGERELHEILRAAGLEGWIGNLEFRARGHTYFLDVAFPEQRVVIELDGWKHHRSKESFENDRRRGNELALAGWFVLRVTPTMVRQEPETVVRWVREALRRPM